MRLIIKTAALAATAIALAGAPAFAAGESDNTSTSSKPKCKKTEVYDKRSKKCVIPKKGEIDNDSLYEAGRELAYAGDYDQAIDVLSLASDRNDKRILNFLGFANRKAGRLEVGIGYYKQALAIDPNYTLVREYYGEALLMKNDLEGAKAELTKIEELCGSRDCEEYLDLAEEIAEYEKNKG